MFQHKPGKLFPGLVNLIWRSKMNKITTILAVALVSCTINTAFAYDTQRIQAQLNNNSTSESWSGAGAGATASAYSDGVNVKGTGNATNGGTVNNVAGSDLSSAVGIATAPALTTTLTETCMGSTSAGAGFSGGSFSFGTTWRDTECVNRLNAREIRTYGDVQAAKEIMCSNDTVREAFKRVGRPCAEDGGIYTVAAPVQPVVEAPVAPAPVAGTDKKVGDEADEMAKRTQMLLDEAEKSAASIRAKGF